jgi:hypothetical protein
MPLQRLKDVEENEIWSINDRDVERLLGVSAKCPHQFMSIQACQTCIHLIAAIALSHLDDIVSGRQE